eukprot:TRINITY_DN62211_c0_g1_i1.p1 TRINITY_DN62211_c0_g1~~TRINITY_DN62211_c0_g1_i1.p1  ORF type:complete len:354 (+),score=72.04 TRINITY_DN62211_c0_g1_i1:79-1140(+)
MKAVRERAERARAALTINIKKADKSSDQNRIREMSEADVARLYRIGRQVMESTNSGMEVLHATRLRDGLAVVVKTRIKKESFKSIHEEREWRITTEYQMNMPKVDTLCELMEVLETREKYYVVMEKVEGEDLFEQMAKKRISHLDAREICRQILEALKVMHSDGRIHKDLKVENVMVDLSPKSAKSTGASRASGSRASRQSREEFPEPCSPATAKLIDFDTVQDWEPSSPKAKDVLGTDGYIAPEAYCGDYSPASDIYSAGVIMYKMLTGKFPSRSDLFDDQPGENWVGSPAMKRIRDRLKVQTMDFSLHPLNKSPEAQELVSRMLAFELHERPTAEECLNHAWFQLDPHTLP